MTRDQQLADIRAACIKANPEIAANQFKLRKTVGTTQQIGDWEPRPVRLADVLLATPKTIYLKALGDVVRLSNDDVGLTYWDLRQDDLTLQGDECVALLAGLFVTTSK